MINCFTVRLQWWRPYHIREVAWRDHFFKTVTTSFYSADLYIGYMCWVLIVRSQSMHFIICYSSVTRIVYIHITYITYTWYSDPCWAWTVKQTSLWVNGIHMYLYMDICMYSISDIKIQGLKKDLISTSYISVYTHKLSFMLPALVWNLWFSTSCSFSASL